MTMQSMLNVLSAPGAPKPGFTADRFGYVVAGAGPTVVLLHSSLGSKSQWAALCERMAARFRLIAIDLCGYGDNALPSARASFTLDDEIRLVAERLDPLVEPGLRVHVVGHSYGGLVALGLARRMRDRVASLSLYEPVVFRMLDEQDAALGELRRLVDRLASQLAAGRRRDAAQGFVDFWSGEGAYASLPPPVQASLARRVDKLPLDFRAASSWPTSAEDLRGIVAPTLLLTGSRSPVIAQRIHALLMRALPQSRAGSFDIGHMGPVTHPDRVNPWIEAFVDLCAENDAAAAASRWTVSNETWVSAN